MLELDYENFLKNIKEDTQFATTFIELIGFIINEQSDLQKYTFLNQLKNLLLEKKLISNDKNQNQEFSYLLHNEEATESCQDYDNKNMIINSFVFEEQDSNEEEGINVFVSEDVEYYYTEEQTNIFTEGENVVVTKDIYDNITQNYPGIEIAPRTSEQLHQNIKDIISTYNQSYSNQFAGYSDLTTKNSEQNNLCKTILEEQEALQEKQYWINKSEIEKIAQEIKNGVPEKIGKLKQYHRSITPLKELLIVDNFEVFNNIENMTPNFAEVIKFYKGNFILNNSRRKHENIYLTPTPILLLGDPGIGKTYFAQLLAKELGTYFHFFDSNSITANWVLSGSSGQWKDADAGHIFKIMLESNTISPIVIFDEIDKLSQGKNYDTFSTFHQLLEPTNAKMFKDEFLNAQFDASNIIYILTANDIKDIPESLLSRMKVFHVQKANSIHTRTIAQNIYNEIIGKSELLNPILSEKNLLKLENMVPREIKKVLKDSVFNQVSELEDTTNNELVISLDDSNKKWGF